MPHLFEKLQIKDITFRNRIAISPMCQYSSEDGMANDWHLVHLGSRAVGGAGLVITEAAAVEPRGRITPDDLGIYKDEHIEPLERVSQFILKHGAVPGIQLAHAGRKGAISSPWKKIKGGSLELSNEDGGWEPVGASANAVTDLHRIPKELNVPEIKEIQRAFGAAARRAREAGYQWIEFHAAHGYLAHNFYSPLSNHRQDEYGGSFENRIRFTVETIRMIREEWPENLPLTVRLSCSDWVEGGWVLEDAIELAKILKKEGVDLITCSSGGNAAGVITSSSSVRYPIGAGYQVPFSEGVRHSANIATGAVGLITSPMQADEIIRNGRADMVLIARQSLRDPYWPYRAAKELGHMERLPMPGQYPVIV